MRNLLKTIIPKQLHKHITKIRKELLSFIYQKNLTKLAFIWETDKGIVHKYTEVYQQVFSKIRLKKLTILEIGVGGYDNPLAGGQSLRMWKRYFRNSQIYAFDIYNKLALQENRVKILQGSQIDLDFLSDLTQKTPTLDIIIDDGSHINEHVITTFRYLFPKLKSKGIYIVEDTQTSYWQDYGGNPSDMNDSNTMMNYFKSLTDSVNSQEFSRNDSLYIYFDNHIESIQFYHNLIIIYKR